MVRLLVIDAGFKVIPWVDIDSVGVTLTYQGDIILQIGDGILGDVTDVTGVIGV